MEKRRADGLKGIPVSAFANGGGRPFLDFECFAVNNSSLRLRDGAERVISMIIQGVCSVETV